MLSEDLKGEKLIVTCSQFSVTSVTEQTSCYYMVRSLGKEYLEQQMIAPAIRAPLSNLRIVYFQILIQEFSI